MIYLGYSGGSCIIFKTLSILEICQIHNHNWRLKMPPCKVKTEQQNNCFFSNLPLTGLSDFSCGNQNPWRISASTDIYITWRWNKRNNFLNCTDESPPGWDRRDIPHESLRVPVSSVTEHEAGRHVEDPGQAAEPGRAGDTAGHCQVTLQGILQDIAR